MSLDKLDEAIVSSLSMLDALAKEGEATASSLESSSAAIHSSTSGFSSVLQQLLGLSGVGLASYAPNAEAEKLKDQLTEATSQLRELTDPKAIAEQQASIDRLQKSLDTAQANPPIGSIVSIPNLLQQLAVLVQEQGAIHSGSLNANVDPRRVIAVDEGIQSIVNLIREYGGAAGRDNFTLEKFKHLLQQSGVTQAATSASGGSVSIGNAPSSGTTDLSGDTVAQSIDPASGAPKPKRRTFLLFPGQKPEESEAAIAREQKELDDLNASATKLNTEVAKASAALTSANDQMAKLRSRAGLDDRDGAISKLNDQLNEAKSTLQYLQDKGKGDAEVNREQGVVDQIQKQIDAAAKQQRIATFEFEHSDAFKRQKELIDAAQKDLDAKQKAADENTAKIDAAQKALDDATKATTDAAAVIKKTGGELVLSFNAAATTNLTLMKSASIEAVTKVNKATSETVTTLTSVMTQFINYLKKNPPEKQPGGGGGAIIPTNIASLVSRGLLR
jgi:hypothetical protein